jgi:hypothetical protein
MTATPLSGMQVITLTHRPRAGTTLRGERAAAGQPAEGGSVAASGHAADGVGRDHGLAPASLIRLPRQITGDVDVDAHRSLAVRGGGDQLGPVGGRIVTEVLIGLLRADHDSYLVADPSWMPTLPSRDAASFDWADLLAFAADQRRPGDSGRPAPPNH